MARVKGGIKKEETFFEKAMKKFKAIAETKGSVSAKEQEFFEKLVNKKNK